VMLGWRCQQVQRPGWYHKPETGRIKWNYGDFPQKKKGTIIASLGVRLIWLSANVSGIDRLCVSVNRLHQQRKALAV
jgi:hypothetical protein